MAAPRVRCAHCGEWFDRRAVNQSYCFEDECRNARNAANVANYRAIVAHRADVRLELAIQRGGAA